VTRYLSLDDLLAAAEAAVGRAPEVRDYGLLESALARPQTTVFGADAYPGLHQKAAALLHSLVRNHALVDGNKRLGWVALRLFYVLNDLDLRADHDDAFDFVMAIAAGELHDLEAMAGWLEPRVVELDR
jgi:death-on-curing protein